MRVAIDSGPLTSGHKVRGIGVHTRELVKALERESRKNKGFSVEAVSPSQIMVEVVTVEGSADKLITYTGVINHPTLEGMNLRTADASMLSGLSAPAGTDTVLVASAPVTVKSVVSDVGAGLGKPFVHGY